MSVSTCRECGNVFTGLSAFDKHRIGKFGEPIYRKRKDGTQTDEIIGYTKHTRHCMSEEDMLAAGMVKNKFGRWSSQAFTEEARARLHANDGNQEDPEEKTA